MPIKSGRVPKADNNHSLYPFLVHIFAGSLSGVFSWLTTLVCYGLMGTKAGAGFYRNVPYCTYAGATTDKP